MGIDQFPRNMCAAQGMACLFKLEIRASAVMNHGSRITRQNAHGIYGVSATFLVEEEITPFAVTGAVKPVQRALYPQARLITVKKRQT